MHTGAAAAAAAARAPCAAPPAVLARARTCQAFKLLLKQQTAPSETAAVIIEPVLGALVAAARLLGRRATNARVRCARRCAGEGGYVPAPASFLRKLRALCTEHKMLLIADEVQTGFGRTGSMFAVEESDVVPDVLIMAKGIASGYPLSAIASRKAIMDTSVPPRRRPRQPRTRRAGRHPAPRAAPTPATPWRARRRSPPCACSATSGCCTTSR